MARHTQYIHYIYIHALLVNCAEQFKVWCKLAAEVSKALVVVMVFFLVPTPPPPLVSFAKQLQVLFIDMQVEDVEYSKWSICKWSIGRLVIPRPVVGDRTTSNGGTKDRQLIVDFNTIQQQGVVQLTLTPLCWILIHPHCTLHSTFTPLNPSISISGEL